MPLPPPPAEAFIMTGRPIFPMISSASFSSDILSGVPGTTGTPVLIIMDLAVILSPMDVIASGEGPIKIIPASVTFLENSAFSERKP